MSFRNMNNQTPGGGSQGSQSRRGPFTLINSRTPLPDGNQMAPPSFGFIPSTNMQQFTNAAQLANFAYLPPQPISNFNNQSPIMFFPQGMYVNPQIPSPPNAPFFPNFPNVPMPPKKKTSLPRRPIRTPNRPSAPTTPHPQGSTNKRQSKDDPRKIKRSKKSKISDHQADSFASGVLGINPMLPGRSPGVNPSPTAGPSGPLSSPQIPNGQGSPLTRDANNDNAQQGTSQEGWISENDLDDEDDGGDGVGGDYHSLHSDSDGSVSGNLSEQASDLGSRPKTVADMRHDLYKLLQKGDQGEEVIKKLVEAQVMQEKRVAQLERKNARNSGESS